MFFLGSVLWAIAIPAATFAASRPAGSRGSYAFALAVYAVGHVVCHQLPARSFQLWMTTLPVCARCSGIYAGAAAVAAALVARRRRPRDENVARARYVLLAACAPTAATLIFEWTTGITPANWIRALAGLPMGAAVAWTIGMLN